MESLPIRENKFSVPDGASRISRTRLYNKLDVHRGIKLVTVSGGPGYGKTALVVGYLQERRIPAIWYSLQESDRYPHIFVHHLKAAICSHRGHRLTLPVTMETYREEADELSHLLANWPSECTIVCDDVQAICRSKEITDMLETLIGPAGDRITFILVGQTMPDLPYAEWAEGRHIAIRDALLAFTREEIVDFFKLASGPSLENVEIDMLVHRTEGWPASLQLIRDAVQSLAVQDRERLWSSSLMRHSSRFPFTWRR